jgi:hypothetical protein
MIFLVASIQGLDAGKPSSTLQAWVNTDSHDQALATINDLIATEGGQILSIIESTVTIQDDYFPPCKSLDAYMEAELEDIALRYS